MRATHLLYLHGFRSSPQSAKAQKMTAWVNRHRPDLTWWCPQLPASPRQAMTGVMQGITGWPQSGMAVIGSSLGGFYATHVAARTGCRAALINPAVDPARDLQRYIGEQTAWHQPHEAFFFEPHFVDELRDLHAGPLQHPENILAIIAKGDEVLDWREMATRYAGAHVRLVDGSDHALSDFDDHFPAILEFTGLAQGNPQGA